jgi:hypothetical protein
VGRKVALDFAVINALGPGHWRQTFDEAGAAELAYDAEKRRHRDTATKCAAAGLVFKPMVASAQGGMTPAMGSIVHRIAKAVATVEGTEPEAVRKDMFERIALTISRANARAVARRRRLLQDGALGAARHRRLCDAADILEDPAVLS